MEQSLPVLGILAFVALFVAILAFQYSQAKAILKYWAEANRYEIVSSQHTFMGGPFWWRKSRGQEVYYVTIRTSDGKIRRGWVRCGGWFWGVFGSNQADVQWDE
jgi:hypothetical protein